MGDYKRNIKRSQRFEYGVYQFLDHFFGRKRIEKLFKQSRRRFYKRLHETLKQSGEGKIVQIDRRRNLSIEEFKKEYLRKGRPVVLEGAANDWPSVKNWSLEYFKKLHGDDEILL